MRLPPRKPPTPPVACRRGQVARGRWLRGGNPSGTLMQVGCICKLLASTNRWGWVVRSPGSATVGDHDVRGSPGLVTGRLAGVADRGRFAPHLNYAQIVKACVTQKYSKRRFCAYCVQSLDPYGSAIWGVKAADGHPRAIVDVW